MLQLTVKERILLHLSEFSKYADSLDVPGDITQAGIARAMRIRLAHVLQYVRPLVREGLVTERLAHVQGVPRRLKAYDLTNAGRMAALTLRDRVRAETVTVREAGGTRTAPMGEVLRAAGPGVSVLAVLDQVAASGTVDLSALGPAPHPGGAALVERLSDAPQPTGFVGRAREIERLTATADGTRVFVIRGVAGIGKSYLAAKACERLRGARSLFWHRVRPWDTRATLVASLAEFLSAMGRPGLRSVLSRGDASRADDVLRADLPGTGAFLVFDDAHDASPEVLAYFAFLKDLLAAAPDVGMVVLTRRKLPFYDRRHVVLGGLVGEIDLEGLGTEEIAAFLGGPEGAPSLVELGRQLGGHPLSLELLRSSSTAAPDVGLRDVRHFIEEEIYRELSDRERVVMRTASLFRIPVPREALLALPASSHDVLLSLQGRSLLRAVGDESYEVHDTIRDFFARTLTASEREALGLQAAEVLRHLALRAYRTGDHLRAVNALSNAMELRPGHEDSELLELLGEANVRIGDVAAALAAYHRALEAVGTPEGQARIHRKAASALEDRGDVASASGEVMAGLRSLGDAASEERGWLDLIRCRIAYRLADWEEARDAGRSALATMEAFRAEAGQARALEILGHIAMHSPESDPAVAEERLSVALGLSGSVGDPEFTADVRMGLAHVRAWHRGDIEGAARQAAEVEALLASGDLPLVRRKYRLFQGMFHLIFFADFADAESHFRAALEEAERTRDTAAVANAKVGLGYAAYFQGRFTDARRAYEEAVDGLRSVGLLVDAVNVLLALSEAYFLEGDQPNGFRILGLLLSDPSLTKAVDARSFYVRLTEGYTYLIQGDRAESVEALADAVARAEAKAGIGEGTMTYDFVGCIAWPAVYALLYSGVALRFLGRPGEGDAQIERARSIARDAGARAWLEGMPKVERGLTEVLRSLLSRGAPAPAGTRPGPSA